MLCGRYGVAAAWEVALRVGVHEIHRYTGGMFLTVAVHPVPTAVMLLLLALITRQNIYCMCLVLPLLAVMELGAELVALHQRTVPIGDCPYRHRVHIAVGIYLRVTVDEVACEVTVCAADSASLPGRPAVLIDQRSLQSIQDGI